MRLGGVPHIIGKLSMRATTLFYTSPQSKVCTRSYGPPKCRKSQFWEFQDGSPGIRSHLDVAFVVNHKKYYKGECGGFPQVWAVLNLVSPCMPLVC
jgi:hypothetical protein